MRRRAGITMIELMVAVAIVAVLAAIAVPSYYGMVEAVHRSEAKGMLGDLYGTENAFFAEAQRFGCLDEIGFQLEGRGHMALWICSDLSGCYFDPIRIDMPNNYMPHMNMRQTPMAYSPKTGYLYASACINPAWIRRAESPWVFLRPTRLPGQQQYGLMAAVDSRTGKLVWQKKLDSQPFTRITGTVKLHDGRLYVPIASQEENAGANSQYSCCSFRGNLVVVKASTDVPVVPSSVSRSRACALIL